MSDTIKEAVMNSIAKKTNRILFFCILACVVCGLGGCKSKTLPGWGGKMISWSNSYADREKVPGIDESSVTFGLWGEGAALVLWSDGRAGVTGGHFDKARCDHYTVSDSMAAYLAKVKEAVHYTGISTMCFTPDAKTGLVQIGSETYRLEDGALFLVSDTGTKVRVKQLNLLAKLNLKPAGARTVDQITTEELQGLAKNDPDIRGFFTEAGKSK
jgi:hypothetical protein